MFKVKLVETQDKLSDEVTSKANLVHDLAEKIGKKLAAAEQKGAEGEVTKQFSIKLHLILKFIIFLDTYQLFVSFRCHNMKSYSNARIIRTFYLVYFLEAKGVFH